VRRSEYPTASWPQQRSVAYAALKIYSSALMQRNPTAEVQIEDPLATVHFATLGTLFRHTDSFCSASSVAGIVPQI
jgi:hypothetical protein